MGAVVDGHSMHRYIIVSLYYTFCHSLMCITCAYQANVLQKVHQVYITVSCELLLDRAEVHWVLHNRPECDDSIDLYAGACKQYLCKP